MKKQTIYYKAIFSPDNNNDCQLSCMVDTPTQIRYILNTWVYPKIKNSKLFVFRSLADTQDFLHRCGIHKNKGYSSQFFHIYECEIKNPKEIKFIYVMNSSACASNIQNFWQQRIYKKKCHPTVPAPQGTIICDAVKLTKKVY